MCGIAGVCNLTRLDAPDEPLLRRMLNAIRHRGPDQFGIYLDGVAALGSARLSIIDLSGGQQPIANEDATLWIVFNGEIFNYIELRSDLERAGHVFRTDTDTEVVLHLFEEHGPDCLRQLNGDFALAIWNSVTRELFLARDRVGVRPLFYTINQGRLLFGSEVKALLADPAVPADLDPVALHQIFTYWSTLSPRTAFRDVWEIPPGCYGVLQNCKLDIRRYWQLEFSEEAAWAERDPADAADELAALLVDATRLRLRADVPVGAYVSGGLDSSTLAAIVRHETATPLETFSIAFSDEQFDESEHQQAVARLLGTQHHVVEASHADIGRIFPALIQHLETPVLRTAPAPMFLLSQLVRQHGFKVVLTGEGADEFFGGYDIFKEAMIRRFWAKRPESKRRPLLLRRLYPEIGGLSAGADMLSAFYGAGLTDVGDFAYSHAIRWRNTSRTKRFFSDAFTSISQELVDAEPATFNLQPSTFPRHPLARAQFLEASIFLPQYLLSSQGDRPAMAHSVEGRFPFLDYRLIEFAGRLPARLKLRGLIEKYLLRKAAARWLPPALAMRRKRPYRAPIDRGFFNEKTPEYLSDILSPDAIAAAGYFKASAVAALTGKLMRSLPVGETDQMALAGIISTQLWHQQFVQRRHLPEPLPANLPVKLCRPESQSVLV